MHVDEIRKLIRAQPFEPFDLFVSDGASYHVKHPDFIALGARNISIVMTSTESSQLPQRVVHVDPVHITRITPATGNDPPIIKRDKR